MQYTRIVLTIALFCSASLYADEMFHFVFGEGATKPVVKQQDKQTCDTCPIDPPLGKDVYVVIVEKDRFRRLGLWSEMDDASRQEAHAYFSQGAVEDSLNETMQLLVCGTEDVHDIRIDQIKMRVT